MDLDGTLTSCDTLHHLLGRLVLTRPWRCVDLPVHAALGRARFKHRVSDRMAVDAARLPYRRSVLEYVQREHAQGRRIVLATAADQRIAEAVARHLGVFTTVLGTRAGNNLKGARKRDAIRAEVGVEFDYAGDSWTDLPIFEAARYALLVSPSTRLRIEAFRRCRVGHIFD